VSCSECGARFKNRNAYNQRYHLRVDHDITSSRAPSAQVTLDGYKKEEFSSVEKFILAISEAPDTFDCVERFWFRKAFNPPFLSSETCRKETLKLSKKLVESHAIDFLHKPCTLTFDSATVFSRFLGVVLQHKEKALPVRVVADTHFDDGRLTASNIATIISELVLYFKSMNVHILALTADNASNMQAVDVDGLQLVKLRCVSHSIQLLLNDMKVFWEEPLALALRLRDLYPNLKLPRYMEQRWTSLYRLLKSVVTKAAEIEEGIDTIKTCVLFLKPFYVATMMSQYRSASVFDALSCLAVLKDHLGQPKYHTARTALEERVRSNFSNDALHLCVFFWPGIDRSTIPQFYFDKCREILTSNQMRNIANEMIGPESLGSSVESEMLEFTLSPPKRLDTEFLVAEEYIAFWVAEAKRFPRLANVAIACAGFASSEAEVERVFSSVKRIVSQERNKMKDDAVQAQLIIYKLARETTEIVDADADEDDEDAVKKWREVSIQTVLWFIGNHKPAAPSVATRKRTRATDSRCGVCEQVEDEHPSENHWVQCACCIRWCMFTCVGLAPHLKELVYNMPSWKCPKCRAVMP